MLKRRKVPRTEKPSLYSLAFNGIHIARRQMLGKLKVQLVKYIDFSAHSR